VSLNLNNLRTPGVYLDEVSVLPPSVAPVETAIAAFVGYTEKRPGDLANVPLLITSWLEYVDHFGGPQTPTELGINVKITRIVKDILEDNGDFIKADTIKESAEVSVKSIRPVHNMYFAVRHYFDNGGGKCYIVSTGGYGAVTDGGLVDGINALEQEDEPTLIIIPETYSLVDKATASATAVDQDDEDAVTAAEDALKIANAAYDNVYQAALNQCKKLMDRFTIIDVRQAVAKPNAAEAMADIEDFQDNRNLGDYGLYGAAYYPYLETTVDLDSPKESQIEVSYEVKQEDGASEAQVPNSIKLEEITGDLMRKQILAAIRNISIVLPPSAAMAGIYSRVDNDRGVWKAPANVSVGSIIGPMAKITNTLQDVMNIDPNGGRSVNAIRHITGRGTLVWGARTLAGNDNEWRYVPVRRFFNFVEESVKKATNQFVFEPNDANTWVKIQGMIENFLRLQWSQGALMGAKPEEAFFVHVGLGKTMTTDDILNGRMIVEIGMAAVRPAEFIVLRFMHYFPEA
jgi:hypothetical protein